MLNKLQDLVINFVPNRKKFYIFSIALILIGLISTFVFGVNIDISFKGGTIIVYSYEGTVDQEAFTKDLSTYFGSSLKVNTSVSTVTGKDQFEVSLNDNKNVELTQVSNVLKMLDEKYSSNKFEQVEISTVDATMGNEFLIKCLVALALASILIVLYIAFRFKSVGGMSAGVMGIVALLHDCFIVYTVYVLFGLSIDDNFMAVMLMIMGYSINDTIVIYDRIRENMRKIKNVELTELVNTSLNQVKVRCFNTTITSCAVMVVVCVISFVFGVSSIRNFAFPMIMGMLSGVYSSLCLAPNLWVDYTLKKSKKA